MYISDLCSRGCKIVYRADLTAKSPYFGVSTVEKLVILYNVEKSDFGQIERLLQQADIQYRGVELGKIY